MKITLALNKPYVPMEFDSKEAAIKYTCARMDDMHKMATENKREVLK